MGKKNGFGQFYYDNGSHYDGYWRNDHKQGEGRFFFIRACIIVENGMRIRWWDCKLEFTSSGNDDINGI